MEDSGADSDDSLAGRPEVPGSGGVAAFTLRVPEPSSIPVLITVPHAGRCYPPALIATMRNPAFAARRLEDRYIDRVGIEVAQETGAALLIAHAPRAMIDLNRSPDDIDWEMVRGGAPREQGTASRRARSGLGLVPRRMHGLGELWQGRMTREELELRMAQIYRPYHRATNATLCGLRERWGVALLVDLHSMPPLGRGAGESRQTSFVLGDRFGASCDGQIVSAAFEYFTASGEKVAHNRPYAGGYVLDRHGKRSEALHALQIEVCRSLYLDSALHEPAAGLAGTVRLLVGLIRRLAAETAALGRNRSAALAAE